MDTLGKRLMNARGNSGLTQAAVAEKLNVSSQAVSLWERDETTPDITKLPEIANQIFLIKYHMTSVIEAIRHDLARKLK